MKGWIVSAMATALVLAMAGPARAEQESAPPSKVDLNVDLKLDHEGFRLGGQLFGLGPVYGAWLNGRFRRDGLSLDGRLQDGNRAFNFKLNADFTERLLRVLGQEAF